MLEHRVAQTKKVRLTAVAVAAAVALLGYGGTEVLRGDEPSSPGYSNTTHKPGHPLPPGCAKVKGKYPNKPKKKCKNHTGG